MAGPTDEDILAGATRQPLDAAALVHRGIVLQALGHYDEALEPLLWATVLAPTNPNAWLQRAMGLRAVLREEQAEHAAAALRELRPMQASMWFAGEVEELLQPFARASRATYLIWVDRDEEAAKEVLTGLVDAYGEAMLPQVRQTVAYALISLGRAEEVIRRFATETDPGLRSCVASALVTQGALLADRGRVHESLASWNQIVQAYGDDPSLRPAVARALHNLAFVYGQHGQTEDQQRILDETVHRYAEAPEPELRRGAARALAQRHDVLRSNHQQQTAQETADRLLTKFRSDPDPVVARLAADARIERWLATRDKRLRFLARPIYWLLRLSAAIRHREPRGIDYPWAAHPKAITALLGRALTAAGRIVQAAATVAVVMFATRVSREGGTTSSRALVCGALIIAGQLVAVLGQRLRGRFTVEVLRLTPRRLPRTLAAAVLALAAMWISPTLERYGKAYVFGPPRDTYRWLREMGLRRWTDLAVMVPLAPIEVLTMITIFTVGVLKPLRSLLGSENALVVALEESFGSVSVEPDEEP